MPEEEEKPVYKRGRTQTKQTTTELFSYLKPVPISSRAMKAGELPGFEAKFNRLWKLFPGSMRDRRDRGEAIKAVSELGVGEFAELVANFPAWLTYWRAFPESERKYIPRIHNWISRGQHMEATAPTRRRFQGFTPGQEDDSTPRQFITVDRTLRVSDCQTREVTAGLGEDGQYRVNDKDAHRNLIVPKPPAAPLMPPLSSEEEDELRELAKSLKALGEG